MGIGKDNIFDICVIKINISKDTILEHSIPYTDTNKCCVCEMTARKETIKYLCVAETCGFKE